MNLAVMDQTGSKVKEVVFAQDKLRVSSQLLNDYVKVFRDHMRPKTGCTKLRPEVSGGGIKPWRQKGTGRARAGSIRSPIWRGGGIIFGPRPRVSSMRINRRAKQEALKAAFVMRARKGRVTLLDKISLDNGKTKDFRKMIDAFKLKGSMLILIESYSEILLRASRNLPNVQLMEWKEVNPYEILHHQNLLITEGAYNQLMKKYFEEPAA